MSEEGYKNIIKTYEIETNELYEEIGKLKSSLEQIREVIDMYNLGKYDYSIPPKGIDDLLQILDEVE